LPIGLFPIASDAYGSFKPSAIKIITLITTAISVAFWIMDASSDAPMGASTNFVLWSGSEPNLLLMLERIPPGEFHYYQLLTNAFLHGGIMHLAGNLVFLLVFGNRVNALLGQWKSVTAYLVLAILASAVFYISEMGKPMVPALGASGAIMGMAGMYFVLMPTSRVYMVFWIRLGIFTGFRRFTKIFSLRGFWVLLFYIAFDIAPAIMHHQDGTAHWAHLGGFASGMTIALGLLVFRGVDAGGGDILTILLGKRAWHLLGKPVDRMLQKIA
jgi:membrane associated rhomboid family serine protease